MPTATRLETVPSQILAGHGNGIDHDDQAHQIFEPFPRDEEEAAVAFKGCNSSSDPTVADLPHVFSQGSMLCWKHYVDTVD